MHAYDMLSMLSMSYACMTIYRALTRMVKTPTSASSCAQFKISADRYAHCEPDWITASGYPKPNPDASKIRSTPSSEPAETKPIMQTDGMKEFYLDIVNYGLHYACLKYKGEMKLLETVKAPKPGSKTTKPKKVVIVGAGVAGLAAAYELVRAGHDVQILEMQQRVGGRIKTMSSESFYPGLWSDGKPALFTCDVLFHRFGFLISQINNKYSLGLRKKSRLFNRTWRTSCAYTKMINAI